MTARLVRIEALVIAALSLAAACSDNQKDLLAPAAPDKLIVFEPRPPILRPVLPGPDDFMEIAAAGSHTCARQYDGDVYCWGLEGEAGYGRIDSVPKLAFTGARQVVVGGTHACILNSAGAAYCRGGGNSGQLGLQLGAQIGYGAGWVLGPKDPNSFGTLPPLAFSSLAASGSSTCGITTSGPLYCWGLAGNVNPQQMTSIPSAILTPGNYSPFFNQIAIGNRHVCGLISGEVDCYGNDEYGQGGSDPNATFYYPGTKILLVALGTDLRSGVTRVASQGDFTCAEVNSTVRCFGYNYDGNLGNAAGGFSWASQAVGNGKQLGSVATGWRHACALDANNEAWCWGYNYWGMVGNGTWSYSTATAQKVNGISTGVGTFGATLKFRALAAGSEHTCAIGTDNHIYCWGHNNFRQLGTWLVGANGQSLAGGWVPAPVFVM